MEKTEEVIKLEQQVDYWKLEYDMIRRLQASTSEELTSALKSLRDELNRGPKLDNKQFILLNLVMASQTAFPHIFSALKRWDMAEKLYQEGILRGHFPK